MNLNTLLKSTFALVLLAVLPSMTTAATETITWIHTDHLGSPIAGRNDAGETTWEQAYAPWGEKQAVAGVRQAPAGVGYTGHVYDEKVGLIYAGARWYDPAMGRFISPDAVRFNLISSSSFNRYAYGNNSAFMFTDPDGHLADIVADIGFIGYSIYTFASEPTWTNGLALGADVAGAMVPFATGLGAAYRAGKHADAVNDIANPVSDTLARVVPGNVNPSSLGAPGASDVFVTNASELRGLTAEQIAQKLTIPSSSSGFRVIEFPSSGVSGIASPINRTNPGFVGKGKTAGGASEFVIPNGPIPEGAIQGVVQ